MSGVGYGPAWRIDGPLPNPPVYGLEQAAAAPAAGVTIVDDLDEEQIERWINGVAVWPYVGDPGHAWNACKGGTASNEKEEGPETPIPEFGAMTAYVPITCTSYRVPDIETFRTRASIVLAAVESGIVAREFIAGDELPLNPHLADGNGTFPNLDAPTNVINALSLLEQEIAKSRQLGLIHMSPRAATILANYHVIDLVGKVLRTKVGSVVIPDAGYVTPPAPAGHAAAGTNQEWMYATGTIEIRRSPLFVNPETPAQALDRGTGATLGEPNSLTFRAERYVLVDWDTQVQAAVLADLCSTEC